MHKMDYDISLLITTLEQRKCPCHYLTLSMIENRDSRGLTACFKKTAKRKIRQKFSAQHFSSIKERQGRQYRHQSVTERTLSVFPNNPPHTGRILEDQYACYAYAVLRSVSQTPPLSARLSFLAPRQKFWSCHCKPTSERKIKLLFSRKVAVVVDGYCLLFTRSR